MKRADCDAILNTFNSELKAAADEGGETVERLQKVTFSLVKAVIDIAQASVERSEDLQDRLDRSRGVL